MSESQFALFQSTRKGDAKPSKKRTKQEVAAQPENQVEAQILGFLRARQWRPIRIQAGTFKSLDGRRFIKGADKGTADWICVRRKEYFFLETKAPEGELRPAQEIWITQARREGIEVRVASRLDLFMVWYRGRFGE